MANSNKTVGNFSKKNPKPMSGPPKNDRMQQIMHDVQSGKMSIEEGVKEMQKAASGN